MEKFITRTFNFSYMILQVIGSMIVQNHAQLDESF